MSYIDKSSAWVLDQFFTFLDANQLGSNDKQIVDNFSVEHNWNATTPDGTHKNGVIKGSSISTTPVSTGNQTINAGNTWTPSTGVYQIVRDDEQSSTGFLEIYISGNWRGLSTLVSSSAGIGIIFCDGTNMRIRCYTGSFVTIYYQKF